MRLQSTLNCLGQAIFFQENTWYRRFAWLPTETIDTGWIWLESYWGRIESDGYSGTDDTYWDCNHWRRWLKRPLEEEKLT